MIFQRQRFAGPVAESRDCALKYVTLIHQSYARRGRLTLLTRLRGWFLTRRLTRMAAIRGVTATVFNTIEEVRTIGDVQASGPLTRRRNLQDAIPGGAPPSFHGPTTFTTSGNVGEVWLTKDTEQVRHTTDHNYPPPQPFPQSPAPKPATITRSRTAPKARTTALNYASGPKYARTPKTAAPQTKKHTRPTPKRKYKFPLFPPPIRPKKVKKAK